MSGALGNFIPIWVCEGLGFGYAGVVWAVGVITLIATIGVVLFLESEADKVARGVEIPKDDPITIKEVPKVLIWPGFWMYWLASQLTYLLYAEVAYMTPYLVDVMGVDPGVSSIYSTFRTYVAMVMAPVGGWMADKVFGKTTKFFMAFFTNSLSCVPNPRPKPMMGPMTGEINMAPMMTGMELTFRPTEAMMMAQAKMKTLVPRKAMFFRMLMLAFS